MGLQHFFFFFKWVRIRVMDSSDNQHSIFQTLLYTAASGHFCCSNTARVFKGTVFWMKGTLLFPPPPSATNVIWTSPRAHSDRSLTLEVSFSGIQPPWQRREDKRRNKAGPSWVRRGRSGLWGWAREGRTWTSSAPLGQWMQTTEPAGARAGKTEPCLSWDTGRAPPHFCLQPCVPQDRKDKEILEPARGWSTQPAWRWASPSRAHLRDWRKVSGDKARQRQVQPDTQSLYGRASRTSARALQVFKTCQN